ncbi:MAG: hypothetical protein L6Q54_10765 [Leptospiraceae bacterium]|nr:hypothetical protein [Leptospiraceae bacterium]
MENKHILQKLMDNTWLLLVLGIVVPTVSYSVWGTIELLNLPKAILP